MVDREVRVGDGGYWSSVHDNSTNELLRKTRQHNTAGRQSNTTSHKAVIFQRKNELPRSGGTRTHDLLCSRQMLLPAELPRQLSLLGRITYTNQGKAKHLNLINK